MKTVFQGDQEVGPQLFEVEGKGRFACSASTYTSIPSSNCAGAMAQLRTAAMNLLRLAGFQSIRAGMQAVMHDIITLLAMATRKPGPSTS